MQAMQNFPPPDESMKSREPGDDDAGLPAGTEQSDLELVRRAQQNERGAFFVKAYRALASFRGDSAFYTWLYRIAVNTARNSIASRQRRPLDYEAELSESEQSNVAARLKHDDTPEATVLSEEIRQTVNSAIEHLPEDLRTAIVLREIEGLSYEEIAAAMDCPVGTVRSRIFRAREAIDRALHPLLD